MIANWHGRQDYHVVVSGPDQRRRTHFPDRSASPRNAAAISGLWMDSKYGSSSYSRKKLACAGVATARSVDVAMRMDSRDVSIGSSVFSSSRAWRYAGGRSFFSLEVLRISFSIASTSP